MKYISVILLTFLVGLVLFDVTANFAGAEKSDWVRHYESLEEMANDCLKHDGEIITYAVKYTKPVFHFQKCEIEADSL